jgi:rubredoxin
MTTVANSPLGYEICLADLLYKCCDEDNYTAETLCQNVLTVQELCSNIQTAASDPLVAGVLTLFLDQVYFDVEELLESVLEEEALWSWVATAARQLDSWCMRVGARSSQAASLVMADSVSSMDHYFLRIVVPAMEHFVGAYSIPPDRAGVVTQFAEALSFVIQRPTVDRIMLKDSTAVAVCLERMRSRGIKLSHLTHASLMTRSDIDAPPSAGHVDMIQIFMGQNTDGNFVAEQYETRRMQDMVTSIAAMLLKNTAVSVEAEFHQIVEIMKQGDGADHVFKEQLIQLVVQHGTSQIAYLDSSGVQMMMVSICRMLRHAVEEERFFCMGCSYQYEVIFGDTTQNVGPGTPFDIIDGRTWKCPVCNGPKSRFISKRASMQEVLSNAGTANLVVSLLGAMSRQTDLIIAREPHVMRLLHECMVLGCTLLSGHSHFVMENYMDALQSSESMEGHPFLKTITVLLGELSSWVHSQLDSEIEVTVLDNTNGYLDVPDDDTDPLSGIQGDPRKDLGMLTLRSLQLLCGGHERVLQEYLASKGIVAEVLSFANRLKDVLHTELPDKLREDVIMILTEIFHALTAFCEGPCGLNQEKLAATDVINISNVILRRALAAVDSTIETRSWCRLIRAVVQMLRSLLEKRPNLNVHDEMVARLDFDLLAEGLVTMHSNLKKHARAKYRNTISDMETKLEDLLRDSDVARDLAAEGQHILSTVLQLIDGSPQAKPKFETGLYGGPLLKISRKLGLDLSLSLRFQSNPEAARPIYTRMETYDFFHERVGQVEIMWDGELVREFFPIPYSCYEFELDETAKTEMPTVLRAENPDQQHQYYLEIFERLGNAVEQKMQYKSRGFAWLRVHQDWLRIISFVLAVVVNIIMIAIYTVDIPTADDLHRGGVHTAAPLKVRLEPKGGVISVSYFLITIVGGIQILCSMLLFIFHCLVQSPLRVHAIWTAKGKKIAMAMSRRTTDGGDSGSRQADLSLGLQMVARMTLLKSVESKLVQQMFNNGSLRKLSIRKQPVAFTLFSLMSLCYALLDTELVYFAVCVLMAIFGTFWMPLLLSFHLLGIIHVSADLQAVTNAIAHTGKQVLLTLMLILVLTYLYTLVLMVNFLKYSESDADTVDERGSSCSELSSCLANSVDAIRQGGIGITMSTPDFDDKDRVVRIIFDTSYFIVISVVLLNMVLGIIIDSFAELRKKNEDLGDRVNNICYICCLDRRTLESGVDGGPTIVLSRVVASPSKLRCTTCRICPPQDNGAQSILLFLLSHASARETRQWRGTQWA